MITGVEKHGRGFTIVELLIVIVVIGILAAITIVAFNGVQNRAKVSVVQSDISQALKQLEAAMITSSTQRYPLTSEINLRSSAGVTLTYSPNITSNEYCVSAANGLVRYAANSIEKLVREGDCQISNGLVVSVPMNGSPSNTGSAGGSFTVNGATLAIGQNGQVNGAYQFGTSTFLTQNITNEFTQITASSWVYRDSVGSTPGIMNGINPVAPSHWEVASNSWRLRLASMDRGGIVDAGQIQAWSHVVFSYSRASGSLRYYLNGSLMYTSTGDSGVNNYFVNGLVIGESNGAARQWLGRIDDFRMYDRVLSDSEIITLYSAGAQ